MQSNLISTLFCQTCNDYRRVMLVRTIATNGVNYPFWICLRCGRGVLINKKRRWVSKSYLKRRNLTVDDLPIWKKNEQPRCVVCGEKGAELHHWALQAIFGPESEDWPKDFLCPKHHDEWHEKVR